MFTYVILHINLVITITGLGFDDLHVYIALSVYQSGAMSDVGFDFIYNIQSSMLFSTFHKSALN